LAFPAALQGLEPVSRQNGKVAERQGRFEQLCPAPMICQ
jgi:hypothetical protein